MHFTRRTFLGASIATMAACGSKNVRDEVDAEFLKLPEREGEVAVEVAPKSMRDLCESALSNISDMSWLNKGDSVFVKLACNSSQEHPAVTSPDAIRALVGFLNDRGAGTVYVGDQSGVAEVRLTKNKRAGSTKALMKKNGIWDAIQDSGATPWMFDDHGWNGYINAKADWDDTWKGDLWLPDIVEKVDPIVYLTRLSSHALAGYTGGIKVSVGWMRDDSRMVLHRDGHLFFERFSEANHFEPIRSKFRFCMTLGEKALLNIGPDFGSEYVFETPHAIASTNLVDHDTMAAAMLPWLDKNDTSLFDLYAPYPKRSAFFNGQLVRSVWGSEAYDAYQPIIAPIDLRPMARDPQRAHLAKLQGARPTTIRVLGEQTGFPEGLVASLESFDDRLLKI